MRDVTAPLTSLVQRWIPPFQNLEQVVNGRARITIACGVGNAKNGWELFQRRLLADCIDNLYVLRGVRVEGGSFQTVNRCVCADFCACGDFPKGASLDRVLAVQAGLTETTSWTLRAIGYRRAWLYYANRPQTSGVEVVQTVFPSPDVRPECEQGEDVRCEVHNFPSGNGLSD